MAPRRTSWLHLIAIAVAAAACTEDGPVPKESEASATTFQPAPTSAPPATTEQSRPSTSERMSGHVEAASALRAALVRGDMESFRDAAAELSGDERAEDVWDVNLDVMRAAARRAREADDPTSGAEALARIGESCSHCHVMLGDPKLPVPKEPPAAEPSSESGRRRRMRRHEWAAASLWTGLAAPSDDAWRRGATVLEAELETAEGAKARGASAEVVELTAQARGAAAVAARSEKPEERRRAFAGVMSTCAPCHEALGVAVP